MAYERLDEALKMLNRRQLLELDTCARCALCTDLCPVYAESKNPLHAPGVRSSKILSLVNKRLSLWARLLGPRPISEGELEELAESTYHCTLCGRCMEACPFGLETHELWLSVRSLLNLLNQTPPRIMMLREMLRENGNPYGLDADMRLDWADYTGLEEAPVKDRAEVAYFVGCTTAFKAVNQEIAYSIASLLNELNVDWTLLGEEEWCCGSPYLLAGDREGAKEAAERNVEALKARGVKTVITGCAGCFRVMRWEYPKLLGGPLPFRVIHAVEYFSEHITSGDLKPEPLDARVAYHDPCELGRLGGVIEEPRIILKVLTTNPVELPESGLEGRCCGGGGLLQAVSDELRLSIVDARLRQASELGVEILTSACPSCKLTFSDGVRDRGYNLEVLDLMELLARQMGL